MTTTDIEVYDAEIVEPQLLTEKQAKALDKRIRTASDKLSTTTENLLELLEQAAAGAIHEALGLSSWTAWFKDAVQIQVSDKFERKELVKMMSGKGMSQRAIAGSLGVSQKTVDRDLDGEVVEEGDTVTSLDGVERPKTRVKDSEPLDAEVEEVEEVTSAATIVAQFYDETANLFAAQSELTLLTDEPKWPNAMKRVAKANLNDIQNIIAALQEIVDNLMGDGE